MMIIDIANSFRAETDGKDPDGHSSTLQDYNRVLWGRKLPDGRDFKLEKFGRVPSLRLFHKSKLGEFTLSSDRMIPPFIHIEYEFATKNKRLTFINDIPLNDRKEFYSLTNTIGNRIIFPSNRVGGMTINQRRGTLGCISDRFDLTLECIKKYYQGEDSPLYKTFSNYDSFFGLFGDFQGYVSYFMLEDLVEDDMKVKFFLEFNGFESQALPQNMYEYLEYKKSVETFINSRNSRISKFASDNKID